MPLHLSQSNKNWDGVCGEIHAGHGQAADDTKRNITKIAGKSPISGKGNFFEKSC